MSPMNSGTDKYIKPVVNEADLQAGNYTIVVDEENKASWGILSITQQTIDNLDAPDYVIVEENETVYQDENGTLVKGKIFKYGSESGYIFTCQCERQCI